VLEKKQFLPFLPSPEPTFRPGRWCLDLYRGPNVLFLYLYLGETMPLAE
jgi:hypothetical protein